MSRTIAGTGGTGSGSVATANNTLLPGFGRSVSGWPPVNGGLPPGFGSSQFPMPNTASYMQTMQQMWGSNIASKALTGASGNTNVDMDAPSTAMFVATNSADKTLELLREGHLMFAASPTTYGYRGTALNLASVNSVLLEAAWEHYGKPTVGTQAAIVPLAPGAAGKRTKVDTSLFGGEELTEQERRRLHAVTVDEAVNRWLPLGPLMSTMRDAHSENTAFVYAIAGSAMMPQLVTGLRVGDAVGLVYTEMAVPPTTGVMYDVAGIPIRDRQLPPRAIQVRFVNLSGHGLNPVNSHVEPYSYIGDVTRINPYDPQIGATDQLIKERKLKLDDKSPVLSWPAVSLPYTRFLGYVKDLTTVGPSQEEVDAAHISATAYEALYASSRMKVSLVRRATAAPSFTMTTREADGRINPPLLT